MGKIDLSKLAERTRDGHCVQNRSSRDVLFFVVGSHDDEDHGGYPDIDLAFAPNRYTKGIRYLHRDGTPYPATK